MYQFMLLADYFQFYVQDESVDGDLAESWDDEAVARLLAVAPGTVGIGTVRNMEVPVSLEILTTSPMPFAFQFIQSHTVSARPTRR